MSEEEQESPGWDGITAACTAVYGDQEPSHWGTILPAMLGGQDPLDGMSAYDAGDHWHYVTYGYSELHVKEGDDPEWSGFGLEMTFRLKKTGEEAPIWPCNLLQNLARYVFSSGNPFGPGHSINANGPIAADQDTAMTCLVFTEDPQLGTIDTPHGKVQFLQAVGITAREKALSASWNADGLLGLLRGESEHLVTDLVRPDLALRPDWVEAADANGWSKADGGLNIELTDESVIALAESLQPVRGTYAVPGLPTLFLEVVPTEIKDHESNIVEVIG